jgi:hypothetical protein
LWPREAGFARVETLMHLRCEVRARAAFFG